MSVVFEGPGVVLHHGDCVEVMRSLPDASVDSVVTDPPYGLEFMGKEWDSPWKATSGDVISDPASVGGFQDGNGGNAFSRSRIRYGREGDDMRAFQAWVEVWAAECLRVLKPGGFLLAFGGSRTWHRLAAGVEDAGFEVRDSIAWLYGSGFPKSMDVSKAIDKAAGATREVVGRDERSKGIRPGANNYGGGGAEYEAGHDLTAPATDAAREWEGWGTALKPAFEPIVVARKPLGEKTVAANVLAHGTGALNIDAARIGDEQRVNSPSGAPGANAYRLTGGDGRNAENARAYAERSKELPPTTVVGRWPTNVLLDGSQAEALDAQSGTSTSRAGGRSTRAESSGWDRQDGGMFDAGRDVPRTGHEDSGGASRFFPTFHYEAKAGTVERPVVDGLGHPTVKPLDLMRWLCRLVTQRGGTVLEPFAGSGTTLEAALIEGFNVIGIELVEEHLPLILQRIQKPLQPTMFGDWDEEAS